MAGPIQRMMIHDEDDRGGRRRMYSIDPADIVAVGILCLALAAAFVACVTVLGLVWGKVSERTSAEIIISRVGGATLTGIASKLIVSKPKTRR